MYPSECRVQKIARRYKKAFLSDQCKEIEENNRVGKTRDRLWQIHFNVWQNQYNIVKFKNKIKLKKKKIRDTK